MIDFKDALDKGFTIQFSFTFTPDKAFIAWCNQFPNHMDTAKYNMTDYSPETIEESK